MFARVPHRPAALPRSRTMAVAGASVGLHAALLLGLLFRPPDVTPRPATPAAIAVSLVSLAAPPAAPPPAPDPADAVAEGAGSEADQASPDATAPTSEPAASEAPARPPADPDTPAAEAVTVATGGCAVPTEVQAALQDTAVRAALRRIPASRRSVANAVMLWDGRWVTSGALADSATAEPIRQAIAAAVRRADPGCAGAPIRGPVFFVVPEDAGVMVLVVGAAAWRWADLAGPGES